MKINHLQLASERFRLFQRCSDQCDRLNLILDDFLFFFYAKIKNKARKKKATKTILNVNDGFQRRAQFSVH